MTSPKGRLIDGAHAVAFGALAGDCRFSAFYPMSPATGIIQRLVDMAATVPLVVEQAEDEIAAVNMVIGATFAGVRAMTATSGSAARSGYWDFGVNRRRVEQLRQELQARDIINQP